MKQLRQLAAIAGNTARELVRNPAYLVLVGFGAAATALSPAFAFFHLGEQLKMVTDLGLGTALVTGLLVGVLGASWAVNEELESLSALAVLAKPVSRTTFLLGKYLGVLAASALAVALLGFSLMLTLRGIGPDSSLFLACGAAGMLLAGAGALVFVKLGVRPLRAAVAGFVIVAAALVVVLDSGGGVAVFDRRVPGWAWALAPALAGVVLQVAVLAAVAVALSTRLALAASLPAVFAVFVLGQLAGDASSVAGSQAKELAEFLKAKPGVRLTAPPRGEEFSVSVEGGAAAARERLADLIGQAKERGLVDLETRVERAGASAAGDTGDTGPAGEEADGAAFRVALARPARSVFAWIVPDLVALQFSDAVAEHVSAGEAAWGSAVPFTVLLGAAGVAALYVAGALVAGCALLRRRDMQ